MLGASETGDQAGRSRVSNESGNHGHDGEEGYDDNDDAIQGGDQN